jgi:type VI secretion system protein VasJ
MDSAVGEDPSLDPAFMALAQAVENRSIQGQTINWSFIRDESERLLAAHKDWRLVTWLALAKAQLDGWAGALEGLTVYADFIAQFGSDAHPRRTRARANFVGFLWEGLARAVDSQEVAAALLAQVEEAVRTVDNLLGESLKDANPGASPFRMLVRGRLASPPQAPSAAVEHVEIAPPPAPPVGAPPAASLHAEAAPPAVPPLGSISPPDLRDALRAIARETRSNDLKDPSSFRYARWAAWFHLDGLPDVESGRTALRSPDQDEAADLEVLLTRGDWKELLLAAEESLARHIWWLDLHHYAVRALAGLGTEYDLAQRTVRAEVSAFLARMPGVERLRFSDGVPLASERSIAALSTHSPSDERSTTARSLLPDGDAPLDDLVTAALAMRPGRERFATILRVAELAVTRKTPRVGRALFKLLLSEVNPTLEAWEPVLCAELLDAYRQSLDDDDVLRDALFERLLVIHPTQAIRT